MMLTLPRRRIIAPALARALASSRPSCINVAIDPEASLPGD